MTPDGEVLDVDPHGVRAVAGALREHSLTVAAQRRVCDGVDVEGADPTIGLALNAFLLTWGSGLTALARELELLGVELGRAADAVVDVDRAHAR